MLQTVVRRFPADESKAFEGSSPGMHGTEVHLSRPGHRIHALKPAGLSIHCVWGAAFSLALSDRTMVLDEGAVLVLNPGHALSGQFRRGASGRMLSVYFEPGAALRALTQLSVEEELLGEFQTAGGELLVSEHLRCAERMLASVMRYIALHADRGESAAWLGEQTGFLLQRLVQSELDILRQVRQLPAVHARTRWTMFRRASAVADLIHCAYHRPLQLEDFAAAAQLSPFHTLRIFKRVYGTTPHEFLQRRRTLAALSLVRTTGISIEELSARVGFTDRTTFYRRARRDYGVCPGEVRGRRDRDGAEGANGTRSGLS